MIQDYEINHRRLRFSCECVELNREQAEIEADLDTIQYIIAKHNLVTFAELLFTEYQN